MVEIILALVGSSAIFGFIQFLIVRRDNRSEKLQEIANSIADLTTHNKKEFESVKHDIDILRVDMNTNDEQLRNKLEENKATTARVRILRASDEISHKMRHSKEWFDQLNDDVDFYESYCKKNPDFRNNKATHAIANINEVYAAALKADDFL